MSSKLNIASIPFKIGSITSFDDYASHVSRLVQTAVGEKADFILFPEMSTFELLGILKTTTDTQKILKDLSGFTSDYLNLFQELAHKESVYIIGGTQMIESRGKLFNTAHLFTPGKEILKQAKLHPIPVVESPYVTPGDEIDLFETEKGKIAIITCYDIEFPEPARIATLKGADILFVPSATLSEQGYWRVRHCAQARSIENQVYTVTASLLGDTGIPGFSFRGQAAILSPCDQEFPHRGVINESDPEQEQVISSELDLELLYDNRQNGAVQPLKDRRFDLLNQLHTMENLSENQSQG